MVTLGEARTYVATKITSPKKAKFIDSFFQRFQTGAYNVLSRGKPIKSLDFFHQCRDKVAYVFVYRFDGEERNRLVPAFTGFYGHEPNLAEILTMGNQVEGYLDSHWETDPEDAPPIAKMADPGLPIDGGYLITIRHQEGQAEHYGYHVTRPYINSANSRKLLYVALAQPMKEAFL